RKRHARETEHEPGAERNHGCVPPTLAARAAALPPAGAQFAPWGGPAALTSDALDRERRRLAAADAERRDAAPAAALAQRAEQRHDDARARCADRVAERARAAVNVDALARNAVF